MKNLRPISVHREKSSTEHKEQDQSLQKQFHNALEISFSLSLSLERVRCWTSLDDDPQKQRRRASADFEPTKLFGGKVQRLKKFVSHSSDLLHPHSPHVVRPSAGPRACQTHAPRKERKKPRKVRANDTYPKRASVWTTKRDEETIETRDGDVPSRTKEASFSRV